MKKKFEKLKTNNSKKNKNAKNGLRVNETFLNVSNENENEYVEEQDQQEPVVKTPIPTNVKTKKNENAENLALIEKLVKFIEEDNTFYETELSKIIKEYENYQQKQDSINSYLRNIIYKQQQQYLKQYKVKDNFKDNQNYQDSIFF